MKTVICYYSVHHGNTRKVVEAMAEGTDTDLIDLKNQPSPELEAYDCIGFASGIYGFDLHPSITTCMQNALPRGKKVFFVYTYGAKPGIAVKTFRKLAEQQGATVLGEYGCKGYDTFGPFKLVGGLAKGHPTEDELKQGRDFFRGCLKKFEL